MRAQNRRTSSSTDLQRPSHKPLFFSSVPSWFTFLFWPSDTIVSHSKAFVYLHFPFFSWHKSQDICRTVAKGDLIWM